jgi:hypothetical protein
VVTFPRQNQVRQLKDTWPIDGLCIYNYQLATQVDRIEKFIHLEPGSNRRSDLRLAKHQKSLTLFSAPGGQLPRFGEHYSYWLQRCARLGLSRSLEPDQVGQQCSFRQPSTPSFSRGQRWERGAYISPTSQERLRCLSIDERTVRPVCTSQTSTIS